MVEGEVFCAFVVLGTFISFDLDVDCKCVFDDV